MHDRTGGAAADAQEEIIAACRMALDRAHFLLGYIVRYDGKCTPQFVDLCREWVEKAYDPDKRQPRRCEHSWAKVVLGNEMLCTRCGVQRSVGCQ